MSVMTLILLLVVLVLLDPRSPDSIRVVHGKVMSSSSQRDVRFAPKADILCAQHDVR
jgi:hypothetical protein